jgi:hypothetical protein
VIGRGRERLLPLAGVAFVALGLAGTAVQPSAPGFVAQPAKVAAWFDGHASGILATQVLYLLAGVALLWFVAALRSALARGPRDAALASAVFAGGVAGASLMLASATADAIGALRVQEQDAIAPQIAATLHDVSMGLYGIAAPTAWAVAVLSAAALALRSGALPRWLALASLPLGIALAIPPISYVAIVVMNLWVLAVAGALAWRPAAAGAEAASAGAAA